MATQDLIGIVEATYRLEKDAHEWLEGLCEASRFDLDHGFGALGHVLRLDEIGPPEVPVGVSCGVEPHVLSKVMPIFRSLTWREKQAIASRGLPCATAIELGGPEFLATRPEYAAMGIKDILAVRAHDLSGRVVLLTASMPHDRGIRERLRARWSQVAVHIGAASRLRFQPQTTIPGPDDAVLTPGGHVAEANGSSRSRTARERLRRAALNIDRARCKRWRNADEALVLWEALVDGRWTLVDRFDSDGRRFLIARKNEPPVRDPRALTSRERQVVAMAAAGHRLKVIAYDLGLSVATVSLHLRNAMRKLRVSTRMELIHLSDPDDRSP